MDRKFYHGGKGREREAEGKGERDWKREESTTKVRSRGGESVREEEGRRVA